MLKVPHLQPLQQWICDSCGQVIDSQQAGWFEIIKDSAGQIVDFRIVHHANSSPLGEGGCYSPNSKGDLHLETVLGSDGLTYLLSFIDLGVHHGKQAKSDVHSDHMRQWTEIVRRLHTPHYEEGRFYIPDAIADGKVDFHPLRPYTQKELNRYIQDYAQDPK